MNGGAAETRLTETGWNAYFHGFHAMVPIMYIAHGKQSLPQKCSAALTVCHNVCIGRQAKVIRFLCCKLNMHEAFDRWIQSCTGNRWRRLPQAVDVLLLPDAARPWHNPWEGRRATGLATGNQFNVIPARSFNTTVCICPTSDPLLDLNTLKIRRFSRQCRT
ncbi:unnamed protein product [Effrenium voratum]|uniref:Uncharacterized protein n=1 Tax=Effrenium voratum TaxID=2562239 RepID=A0AA36NDW6_9DINO|nr:unnamed protein product [Effrenium voratum]CAJ1455936.1 unnamed protein product [Effrenium voratum]